METSEYAGNLVLADVFRRFGRPALVITRLIQELSWHVAWPFVEGG